MQASEQASAATRLRASLLRQGREPVDAFRLIPFGPLQVEQQPPLSCTFDRGQATELAAWFQQLGRRLAIDYEHQSFGPLNLRPDRLSPAAGWIGGLEVRDDGLWAVEVEWTARASDLLTTGEYRYFSPVLIWADARRERIAALGPVALTNDPAMHNVPALAASRQGAPNEFAGALRAARDEVAALQTELREQRADRFVEDGVQAGKILDSTRGDWQALFLREPRVAADRLERAPVLMPPGQLTGPDGHEGQSHPGTWIEDADLQAYDRVAAAGHVQVHGTGGGGWH